MATKKSKGLKKGKKIQHTKPLMKVYIKEG